MANYYKGSFVNTQVDYTDNSPNEQTFFVTITDITEDDGSEVTLEMADAPIVLQTVDNSEDKFTTIKSKSCTIRVFTNDIVNAMTFAGGGDTQYKVEVAVNTESDVIYSGWLSLSDLGQTFQPDPNVLQLIATDGIAFLQSVPLSDNEGRYLQGPHPLIKYIAWALQKTGLNLDIWVQMNLLEVSAIYDYPEYHFYNTVYLDAQTFEANVGELEDCYKVLDKILGEFCEISQQKNKWFIKSIDEANYAQFRICRFNSDGDPIDYITELYAKDIGADSQYYTMAFMNDDARLSLQRPYKSVKHNYDYRFPEELVQNINFERGVEPYQPSPILPLSTETFTPQSWLLARAGDGTGGAWLDLYKQPGAIGNIIKTYEYGYEVDRYMKVQHDDVAGTDFMHYVKSTPFYVKKGDRITVSVDVGQDVTLNIINPVHVWLETPINYYTWQLDTTSLNAEGEPIVNQWVEKPKPLTAAIADNPFTQMWRMQMQTVSAGDKLPKYKTISGTIEVPADGKIWIRLCVNFNIFAPIYFSNLSINISSRVNGSYQTYTGQQHISEQDLDTLASREETVYMSDAPTISMKGSMLKTSLDTVFYTGNAIFDDSGNATFDGFLLPYMNLNDYIRIQNTALNNGKFRIVALSYSVTLNKTAISFDEPTFSEIDTNTQLESYKYDLTETFYDSIDWPGGGAPIQDQVPYGQHQNQAVWNQFNRVFSAFEASVDGLDTDKTDNLGLPDLPDLMHMYRQQDTHPATYNKQFKCLHYEQDTDNCEWSIYMIEVGDGSIPKSYDGHSFKYIQR